MPVIVHPHPDFASLLAAMPAPGGSVVPRRRPVVVPSLTFSDALQSGIADRFGLCMGMEFLMPQDFVHRAVGPGPESPWAKGRLVWKVLPHVAAYAGRLGVADPSPRDRFALAGLLADRIDQYGHFRPEMIRRWAAGKWAGDEAAENEDWQRELWGRLRDDLEEIHPALAMQALQRDAAARRAVAERYPDLLVVGAGTLDPLLVEVLQVLAEGGSAIAVHVVLPSLGYLGDLRRKGSLVPVETDPEDISIPAGHPLLESMGRQAIGAFQLLGRLDDQYTGWPDSSPPLPARDTLLGRLQSDIRALRPPSSRAVDPCDQSLRVHSCFGPRREMEVLRDELLRAFDELDGLAPHEIHIVTQDLPTYAPLVSAVLRRGETPLPVQLSELPPSEADPVLDGLAALLGMAHSGRFEAAEVLGLLDKPAVLAALETDDAEALRRGIRDCGLTHGCGVSGSATPSRHRLLAGRWFSPDADVRYPDGSHVLPVGDPLASDIRLGERFADWLATLEETVRTWQPAPAREWARRISAATGVLIAGSGEDSGSVAALAALLAAESCPEPLDAGAILDWLAGAETGRRARLAGGVAFGRFKHMQSLPCRVLAMVGMNDTAFPARHQAPAWDLLKARPCVWDRNARVDDRQLFLDALLTPSDRLILTAPTRNLQTLETEPFSSCVEELLRVVAEMGGGCPVVAQRLQPFAADYFRADGAVPRSYDAFHANVARGLLAGGSPEPFSDSAAAAPAPRDLDAGQFAVFWKDPARAFLRACRIALPRDEPLDEELNRSPFEMEGLARWSVREEILGALLTGEVDPDALRARLAATRRLPPGAMADSAWAPLVQELHPLAAAIRANLGATHAVEFSSDIRLTARLQLSADGGALVAWSSGKVEKPRHYMGSWLHALVASACGVELPTLLFDLNRSDTPAVLAPISAEAARLQLERLAAFYREGLSRPLCFAPATSHYLWKKLNSSDADRALALAEAEWEKEDRGHGGGEGLCEEALLAWRDASPFANREEWLRLAREVSGPLAAWGGIS